MEICSTALISELTWQTNFFFKKWAIPGLFFFIFVFSLQLTVNKCSI